MATSDRTAGNLFREIDDELERRANAQLRPSGLTLSQMGVLMRLRDAPDGIMTVSELAERLHVSQPTASGLVNRLEQKGLVRVLGDTSDRRVRNVLVTSEGRRLCAEGDGHMRATEERLLRGLAPDERAEFLCLLARVHDDLLGPEVSVL